MNSLLCKFYLNKVAKEKKKPLQIVNRTVQDVNRMMCGCNLLLFTNLSILCISDCFLKGKGL